MVKSLSWPAKLYILATLLVGTGLSVWHWVGLQLMEPWLILTCVPD